MNAKFLLPSCLAALLLGGCSYATTKVQAIDDRPTLAVTNASATALLAIDGIVVGPAAAYDEKTNVLRLESGNHRVQIMDAGRTIFDENVYLGKDMMKSISVAN